MRDWALEAFFIKIQALSISMFNFVLWLLAGFAGMEVASYLIHRFVFHGPFWTVHETHHKPNHHTWEANDFFSLFFSLVSLFMIGFGAQQPFGHWMLPVGLGIAIYGILYFVVHDLYTHRRFYPFKSSNRLLQTIRRAHQRHHQTADKVGNEPYGLFLFPYNRYNKPFQRQKKKAPVGEE